MKTVDVLFEESGLWIEDVAERSKLAEERVEAIALGRWTPSPHVSRRPNSSGRIGANAGARHLSVDRKPVAGDVAVFRSYSDGKAQHSWDGSLEMNVRT